MGEVVGIKPTPTRDDFGFVQDMARFSEGLTDESAIRKKYRLADDVWVALGNDDDLVRAITDEKTRRVRDGSAKREKSQALVVKAPDVLSNILNDAGQSARHRIDSAKVLNDFASNGPGQSAPASDRILIQINIGDETLKFDKSRTPDADPLNTDDTLEEWLPAIAASKREEGGSGQPV